MDPFLIILETTRYGRRARVSLITFVLIDGQNGVDSAHEDVLRHGDHVRVLRETRDSVIFVENLDFHLGRVVSRGESAVGNVNLVRSTINHNM